MIWGFCWSFCWSKLSYCWKCSFLTCCGEEEYWLTTSNRSCCPVGCLFSPKFLWLCHESHFFGSRTKVQEGHIASWEVLLPWCHWYWSPHILKFPICILLRRINLGHYCPMIHLSIQQAHLCLSPAFLSGRQVGFRVIQICCFQVRTWCSPRGRTLLLFL